jgi:quercetin dioxygenase-like cupin family protein
MKIVGRDELPKIRVRMPGAGKAFKQLAISSADGAPGFSFRVFTLKPGGHTPYHRHGFEHLNYVISGKGLLVTESGAKPVGRGDFAVVLPGEKHQYRNASRKTDLVFICAVPREYE